MVLKWLFIHASPGYMVSGHGAWAPGSTAAKLFTNQNPIRGTSGVITVCIANF